MSKETKKAEEEIPLTEIPQDQNPLNQEPLEIDIKKENEGLASIFNDNVEIEELLNKMISDNQSFIEKQEETTQKLDLEIAELAPERQDEQIINLYADLLGREENLVNEKQLRREMIAHLMNNNQKAKKIKAELIEIIQDERLWWHRHQIQPG